MGVSTIAVDDNGTIYIGTSMGYRNSGGYSAGVWRSQDNGNSWVNLADIGPDTYHNSVWSIRIFDGYMFVVMDRKVLRGSISSDLSLPGAFTDITPIPGQGDHGRYNDIDEFRETPTTAVLVLTSESKGGRAGGGLVHTSTNGGDTWTDVTTTFSLLNQTFVVNMAQTSAFIDYNNSDPNSWQVNNPANLAFLPNTVDAVAQVAYHQPLPYPLYGLIHQGTYDLVLDFEKDPNATVRVYTQDGPPQEPVVPTNLLYEFNSGTGGLVSVPVEVVGYPHRLVFVAEYTGTAVNGVQINSVTLQTEDMERFRVSAVNDLTSPFAGIYVASLPPSVAGPWPSDALKVYRITEVGQSFELFHSFPNAQVINAGLFGENGGEFEITGNGNMYFGGSNNSNFSNSIKVFRAVDGYNTNIGSQFCHADTRALYVVDDAADGAETILKGDDGGVSIAYNGGATTLIMSSLNGDYFPITQFYGMGIDEREQYILAGAQDNGSWRYDMPVGAWTNPYGGDGGESRVFTSNDGSYSARGRIVNGTTYLEHFGTTACTRSNSISPWALGNPIELHEVKSENKVRAYLSHKVLWKLDCALPSPGQNMMLSLPDYNNFVWGIGVHEDDDDLIFVGGSHISWNPDVDQPHGLLRTRDNGATWVDLTPQLRNLTTGTGPQPMAYFGISDVIVDSEVSADQPATVYVSFDGFAHDYTRRVYKSVDDGESWTDISNGLPIFPVNDLELQKGSGGILYAATDAGIYVYDPQLGEWNCFSEALPICIATEVKANICTGKLYASTFGRGIWVTDVYEPQRISELSISSNTTISGVEVGRSSIVVEPGVILTITGELRMYMHRKIIVKQNARLVVDGGKITAQCGDFWQGIEVWGSNAHNQFPSMQPTHQGIVVLRNGAVIEHAREAITMQQPGTYWTFGGVVQASDATFLNCRRSVEFLNYQNTTGGGNPIANRSFFRRVNFIVDDDYRGGDDFYAHVSMWGVDGINFHACRFENQQSTITESAKLGYGIISVDAHYRVLGLCTTNPPWVGDVCPEYEPTVFNGLDHGINARNSSTARNFIVRNCYFEDNVCGVYANGVVGFQVRNSRFLVGGNEVIVMNNPDEFFWNDRHRAVFSTESWAFAIDDNVVEQSGDHELTEGIVVGYSRDHNDVVFRNQATGLERAFIGEGICADLTAGYTATRGLWFLCNDNVDNSTNFWARKVFTDQVNPLNTHTIRLNQGMPSRPADNTFDQWAVGSGKWDFRLTTTHSPVIYWHRNTGNFVPVSYTISPTGLFPAPATGIPTNNCAQKVLLTIPYEPDFASGMAPGPVVQYLLDEKLAFGNTRYLYEQLIDDGNTDEVVLEIQESWPQDAWELRASLLSRSPYLSTTVLREMVLRNIMPAAMVTEILVANPAATRSDGFLTWLQEESGYPLPEYLLGMVVASWDERGYRDALEAEMTLHHAEMTQAANLLIHHYHTLPLAEEDSTGVPMDSVLWVWQQVRTPAARYAEALTWMQLGNYAQASDVIESLPTEHKLRSPDEQERQRMLDLISFVADIRGNGRSEMQLDSGEVAALQVLMGDAYDRPAALISNLLCFGYGHCRPPLTGGEDDGHPKALPHTPLPPIGTVSQAELRIHPNPASTWVAIDYDLLVEPTDAAIIIRDMTGREVKRIMLRDQKHQVVWDTRQVAPGSYTVVLQNKQRQLRAEKLIIRQ